MSNVGKLEKARRLADRGRYEEAMELVRGLELSKIKALADLSGVADIYAANGYTEEAIQILKRVYEKNKTRRVLYQMAVFSVKLKAVEEAERYYQEFLAVAPADADQYVLRFLIDHLKKAPISVQIQSLETLKEYEYVEEWAYQLAKLYQRAGMEEKCIRECHDIEIWFGEGPIVEKAAQLRASFRAETKTARPLQWGQAEFPKRGVRQKQPEYTQMEQIQIEPQPFGAEPFEEEQTGFSEQNFYYGESEAERQRELEQQREAERQRELELQKEAERQRELELQKEAERQRELEQQREAERQRELEQQRELERQRELEQLREAERQRELERQREAERREELERQKEAERQRELEQQREAERQRELEQLREAEQQRELERQKEAERREELERQKEAERQRELEQQREAERQRELEQQKEAKRQEELERQKEAERLKRVSVKTKPLPIPGDPLVRLAVRSLEEDDYILTAEQVGWLGELADELRAKYGKETALNSQMQELVEHIIDRAERRNMKRLLEIVNKSSYRESGLLCLEREDFLVI